MPCREEGSTRHPNGRSLVGHQAACHVADHLARLLHREVDFVQVVDDLAVERKKERKKEKGSVKPVSVSEEAIRRSPVSSAEAV